MKAPQILTAFLALAVLAAGALAWNQHRHVQAALAAVADLHARSAAVKAKAAAPAVPAGREELSEAEKLELLRLRADVTRLQKARKELAVVEPENARLRELAAKPSAVAAPGQIPVPPGYVRRQDARNVGAGTPEAAMQSLLWAMEQRDTDAMIRMLAPESVESFQEEIGRRGMDEFWKHGRPPGWRVVSTTLNASGTEASMSVEIIPGETPQMMHAVLVDGAWRLAP